MRHKLRWPTRFGLLHLALLCWIVPSVAYAEDDFDICAMDRDSWEFWLFMSEDDPALKEVSEAHLRACVDVRLDRISPEEAKQQFKDQYGSVFVKLMQDQVDDLFRFAWRSSIFVLSKFVGINSAPYWVIWILSDVLLLILLLLSTFLKTLEVPILWLALAHFAAFLLLLAGGFVAFLNVIAVLVGIVASVVGIALGVRSLLSAKSKR